jgi:hypothetical protein
MVIDHITMILIDIATIIPKKDTLIVIGIPIMDLVEVIMAIGGCTLFGILNTLNIIFTLVIADEIFENSSSLSWW